MSDFKHTSGPWKFDPELAEIFVTDKTGYQECVTSLDVAISEADANLIAASPDLLELAILGGNMSEAYRLFIETLKPEDLTLAQEFEAAYDKKHAEVMAKVAGVP